MEPKGSLTFSQHPATYLRPEPVEATSRPPNLSLWQPWILLSHPRLCLHSSFFTSDFPTKTLHAFLFSTTRVGCAIHLFVINLIIPIILMRRTKFWSSSLCRLNDMKAWFWIAKWRSLIIIIRSWHVWMQHCEFTWREYANAWNISIGVAGQHRHFGLMSNTYKNPECLLIPSEYIQLFYANWIIHATKIKHRTNERLTIKAFSTSFINPLTPNDPYSSRTAPLTSKRCILYIYSTNTGTEYFKHGIHSPFFFSLQNAVCFIILTYLVPVLFTFYIQCVLKLKKNHSGAKSLITANVTFVTEPSWGYTRTRLLSWSKITPNAITGNWIPDKTLIRYLTKLTSMAQANGALTAQSRLRNQVSPRGNCGRQSSSGTGFYRITLNFPC